MDSETKEEKIEPEKAKPRVPNWVVHILLTAISVVFGKLTFQTDRENTTLRKENAELKIALDTCLNHRFSEMTHRDDEKTKEIKELREENQRRFNSLINKK